MDDLIPIDSLQLDNVSFIKIDVEQMENAVLDGAKQTILKNKPVILLEIKGGYFVDTAPKEIQEEIEFTKKKISEMGYSVYRIGWWDYLGIPK